ncbi:hypothetical protein [Egicoccus halophilus]|uniref:Uncharacterized protein n=1 Tax=Egicoccus halophilus TaxID=1670830 RepID=A0A8J3AAB7_9ACTN|nr:hypothetical protein [Egicoccus halophilus]GGI06302.1 hypothetical protein GCM10011354_18410 [Egicoccus halophilus]
MTRPTAAASEQPIDTQGSFPAPHPEEHHAMNNVIRLNVPPDQTVEDEAALVAAVAASYTESTGSDDVTVEVRRSEEVDYRAVAAMQSSRWAG